MPNLQIQPASVPAMVLAHAQYLRSPQYAFYVTNYFQELTKHNSQSWKVANEIIGPNHSQFLTDEFGRTWCEDAANRLNISQLFHVSEPMHHVAAVASETIPGDTPFLFEDWPSLNGFLVFETPMHILDVWGTTVSLGAVSWRHAEWKLPHTGSRVGMQICYFSDTLDPEDSVNQKMKGKKRYSVGRWEIGHFGFIPFGESVGAYDLDDDTLDTYRSHANNPVPEDEWEASRYQFRPGNVPRILYAIFQLMQQTVSIVSEHEDTRHARRFRQGKVTTPPLVTVVKLRRESDYGKRDGDGQWLTYRYIRRGHWRKQPYGPGRTEHKTIWISPTMVGDPSLPFHQPTHVTSLQR